jgi:hypothetical protein
VEDLIKFASEMNLECKRDCMWRIEDWRLIMSHQPSTSTFSPQNKSQPVYLTGGWWLVAGVDLIRQGNRRRSLTNSNFVLREQATERTCQTPPHFSGRRSYISRPVSKYCTAYSGGAARHQVQLTWTTLMRTCCLLLEETQVYKPTLATKTW